MTATRAILYPNKTEEVPVSVCS